MVTVVEIKDLGGVVEIWTNNRFSASFATGSQAAYPEAVESNRIECDRKVQDYVKDLRQWYPDMIVEQIIVERLTRSADTASQNKNR